MADEIVNEAAAPVAAPEAAPVAADSDNQYAKVMDLLKKSFDAFVAEAEKGYTNKAAALRARKASLVLRKNLQQWRDISIANDKVAK